MNLYVTAYRGDEEPWRLVRVSKLAEQLPPVVRSKVRELCDHKGTVVVRWAVTPTPLDRRAVKREWRALDENEVHHIVPDPEGV